MVQACCLKDFRIIEQTRGDPDAGDQHGGGTGLDEDSRGWVVAAIQLLSVYADASHRCEPNSVRLNLALHSRVFSVWRPLSLEADDKESLGGGSAVISLQESDEEGSGYLALICSRCGITSTST